MKLRLHHIEMCVKDLEGTVKSFVERYGMVYAGRRETTLCEQAVVRMGKTTLVITKRAGHRKGGSTGLKEVRNGGPEAKEAFVPGTEPWTVFCCAEKGEPDHIDSVFNIALEVGNLEGCLRRMESLGVEILQGLRNGDEAGKVRYAVVKSCLGNIVHTLIEKDASFMDWFLPGFEKCSHATTKWAGEMSTDASLCEGSFFDHVALVCHQGDSDSILDWYNETFEMKRFITNREESEAEGLVIGDDVGLRLKVMEFWKCSDVGLSSSKSCEETEEEEDWEELKIVIAESLPDIKNTQVENFIRDHHGPGIQHIGLHTSDMVPMVEGLIGRGVNFRQPPPTYYTEIGQLKAILAAGEDPQVLAKYGILLDDEADPFDDVSHVIQDCHDTQRYLMQIFTYPIFDRDTFFLEVIQRKNARGFGVGNVTALARSVNAYQKMMERLGEESG